jgi:hypothetical protein
VNKRSGGDAKAACIIATKPPPRQLQLYNSAAAAGAEYNRSLIGGFEVFFNSCVLSFILFIFFSRLSS